MAVRPLSRELQRIATCELNEIPHKIRDDLDHIKDWISKQPHLKCRSDDQWLLAFLRGCKHSLQRTKEKLGLYHDMKSHMPEIFADRDPLSADIQACLKRGLGIMLPTVDDLPYRIVFSRMTLANPQEQSHEILMKMNFLYSDMLMNDDTCVVGGVHLFVDYEGVSFNYVAEINPRMIQKTITCVRSYPIRVLGLHLINLPPYCEAMFNIIKKFLSTKDLSRVHLYNKENTSDLTKVIPLSILPKEYGGEGGSYDALAAEWKLKVESFREWFLEDAAYRSEGPKQPEKEQNSSEVFGISGSFRKLDID